MGPDEQAVEQKRPCDARRRYLRQGNAEEDHAPQQKVHADQRADETDQHAAEERVAQKKAGAQDIAERAHADESVAVSRPFSGISRGAGRLTAAPSSTSINECSTLAMRPT